MERLISNTVNLQFTDVIVHVDIQRISIRIRTVNSVVVVIDVSAMIRAGDYDRIRFYGSSVMGIHNTQHTVLFIGCVKYVDENPRKCELKLLFLSGTKSV